MALEIALHPALPSAQPALECFQVDILGRKDPVLIRIAPSTPMTEIKEKLATVTGIPVKDQKLLLSGIDRLTMGSRKTNLRFGSCGTADSISFAVKTEQPLS